MRLVAPKPFTYKGGHRAVLLLHGFTGSTVDVRRLGRYLQENGYTCHAPLYKGHGTGPEELVQTGPNDWWQNVREGYQFLRNEGYEDIAVAGVSLGGVFSLKIGIEHPVKGIVSMSAPAQEKSIDDLYKRVQDYAKGYKKLEEKTEEQIQAEMKEFAENPMPSIKDLQQLIVETSEQLNQISSPISILYGGLDDILYQESAQIIFNIVHSKDKQLKQYGHSGHIITLGEEREKVYKDVLHFLEDLNW